VDIQTIKKAQRVAFYYIFVMNK